MKSVNKFVCMWRATCITGREWDLKCLSHTSPSLSRRSVVTAMLPQPAAKVPHRPITAPPPISTKATHHIYSNPNFLNNLFHLVYTNFTTFSVCAYRGRLIIRTFPSEAVSCTSLLHHPFGDEKKLWIVKTNCYLDWTLRYYYFKVSFLWRNMFYTKHIFL